MIRILISSLMSLVSEREFLTLISLDVGHLLLGYTVDCRSVQNSFFTSRNWSWIHLHINFPLELWPTSFNDPWLEYFWSYYHYTMIVNIKIPRVNYRVSANYRNNGRQLVVDHIFMPINSGNITIILHTPGPGIQTINCLFIQPGDNWPSMDTTLYQPPATVQHSIKLDLTRQHLQT